MAVEVLVVDDGSGNMVFRKEQAITAIKKSLAQPYQEPVAWGVFDDNLHDMFFAKEEAQEMVRLKGDGSTVKPLYTTPPQRTWVDLTDDEISASSKGNMTRNGFARVLLAKLKDKNTRGQK